MSVLYIAIIIVLATIEQSFCKIRTCVQQDHCIPVPAGVCDNRKCLLVDIGNMNDIVGSGAVPYMWSIATAELNGSCPFKLTYNASSDFDGNKMDRTLTFYSGPSCNLSRTVMAPAEGDLDPHTGQMRILKQKQAGDTYEVCFLYVELGVAHVYRKCLVDNGTLPSGQACAAIYIAQKTGYCASSNLAEFMNRLGVDFPRISVECRVPAD